MYVCVPRNNNKIEPDLYEVLKTCYRLWMCDVNDIIDDPSNKLNT